MLVEGASTSCNGNDTAAKGNDEDMDDSPGPVIKHESFSFFLLFIILIQSDADRVNLGKTEKTSYVLI